MGSRGFKGSGRRIKKKRREVLWKRWLKYAGFTNDEKPVNRSNLQNL